MPSWLLLGLISTNKGDGLGSFALRMLGASSIFYIMFLSFGLLAQPSISFRSPITSLKEKESDQKLTLKLFQYSYLSESILSNQPTNVTALGLASKNEAELSHRLELKSDIQGLFAEQESDRPYVTVPELYLQYGKRTSITLGRKLHSWSKFDELWKLGIWQPLARWDYIHPQTQGFTGLFFQHHGSSGFEVSAFATPIFLPDQGPNFELQNGQFTSQNRWFWAPQSEVGLFADTSEIFYELNRPSEEEVIFNGGGGFQAKLTAENGFWVAAAHAYKPLNQLHLGVDPSYQIDLENQGRIRAEISTRVAYHHLSSAELGWKGEGGAITASLMRDAPEDVGIPSDWVQSSLVETFFAGLQADHRFELGSLKNGRLRYAYMKSWFGERVNGRNIFSGDLDSSLSRFNFEDVAMLEVGQPLLAASGQPITLGFKYFYSFPEQGELLSGQVHWKTSRNLSWVALIDVLGARGERETEVGAGLMSRYRANDRIAIGVTYVY